MSVISCTGGKPARDYFISKEGDDLSRGTYKHPWKTLNRLNNADLEPGDRVFLEGGSMFEGVLYLDSADSGITGKPVVIGSYGTGWAEISGGDSVAVLASKVSNFEIRNLKLTGNGRKTGNKTDGFIAESCSDWIADSLEISGFQHSGLLVFGSRNAHITNVVAHDNGFAGIHVSGDIVNHYSLYDNENLYIGHSRAFNNPGDPTVLSNHSGNGILAATVNGGLIEHCEAFNNGWDMPWTGNGPVGIWLWDCNNVAIRNCVAHNNKTNPVAADGGGFDLDGGCSDCIIEKCISYNNQGAGYGLFEFGAAKPWRNNVVRYCISYNDGHINGAAVNVWKGNGAGVMENCEVYNNTFVNDTLKGSVLSFMSNVPGFSFTNNIFVFTESLILPGHKTSDEKFLNNCYWNPGGLTDKTKQALLRADTLAIFSDPGFSGEGASPLSDIAGLFTPAKGSPVTDRAICTLPGLRLNPPVTDAAGKKIPAGKCYDIGAVEGQ